MKNRGKQSRLRETDIQEVFDALNSTRFAEPQADTCTRSAFIEEHTASRSVDMAIEAARDDG